MDKAVEDKIDDEIAALERLDADDIEALREHRLQADEEDGGEALPLESPSATPNIPRFPPRKTSSPSSRPANASFATSSAKNWPCKVMDKHLNILAKQHIETRFVKLNAEKSPFLAEKLKIIVLPTLALSLSGSLFFFGRY
ncbi:hypothetical protein AAZX31_U023600 [Glycine max]